MIVSVSADAMADVRQAIDWYVAHNAIDAAIGLQREMARALSLLADLPGLGSPSGHGTRAWPLRRFHVSLIYRVGGGQLRVIAVASHRRKPGYWNDRH
ncbi:type II toxin-antitoxin system RelE/ParE family toxin [Piscinibacter sakaiensis]|uniref:type II toxin-antitoxin system RelE/ParE family toxin n=1 Tax=Piscinibacter sakaiensis TaxID=1547922 RepID=UPI003AAD6619